MGPDQVERRGTVVPIAAADALALMVFVLVGIRSHHGIGALELFLRNAVPLEVMWFATAAFSGAYRRPGLRTLLRTWIVAVPAGLVARTLWVTSTSGTGSTVASWWSLLLFLVIGLVFTLLFLLAGRAVAGVATRMGSRRRLERDSIAP